MKQNDKYLAEGLDILNREFGQPLPTLKDTMKAHKLKKEGPDDVRAARRVLSKIAKTEQKFRKEMLELEQAFLQDPRSENKKAARDIKKSYKQGVTTFMRDAVQMIKRMK
tara:strand:- start:1091 stop:1420 length:330 start_codon:yes stop_codon:yes gene_type:complete